MKLFQPFSYAITKGKCPVQCSKNLKKLPFPIDPFFWSFESIVSSPFSNKKEIQKNDLPSRRPSWNFSLNPSPAPKSCLSQKILWGFGLAVSEFPRETNVADERKKKKMKGSITNHQSSLSSISLPCDKIFHLFKIEGSVNLKLSGDGRRVGKRWNWRFGEPNSGDSSWG